MRTLRESDGQIVELEGEPQLTNWLYNQALGVWMAARTREMERCRAGMLRSLRRQWPGH